MKFEFVDNETLHKSGHGSELLNAFAAALREQPGRWAKWPKQNSPSSISAQAARINHPDRNQGGYLAFKGGGYEACTRRGTLYVRYTGERQPQ